MKMWRSQKKKKKPRQRGERARFKAPEENSSNFRAPSLLPNSADPTDNSLLTTPAIRFICFLTDTAMPLALKAPDLCFDVSPSAVHNRRLRRANLINAMDQAESHYGASD